MTAADLFLAALLAPAWLIVAGLGALALASVALRRWSRR